MTNVHPDAPPEVKEAAKRRPCIRCGFPPYAVFTESAALTECPMCGRMRPFWETWKRDDY